MTDGKRYRMGRIFGPDGRALILPIDHGLSLGRIAGLEDPVERTAELLGLGCDGFLMGPGLVRHTTDLFARRDAPARLLTLDTHWRDDGEELSASGLIATVETAARLGADAVKLFMAWNVSVEERQATVTRIGEVAREAERHDMPLMVEPIVVGGKRDAATIEVEGSAARTAWELGADIIKVAHPGPELMASWVRELRVPIVVLGGPRSGHADAVLDLARETVAAGASGIIIGRNVWQREPDVTRRLVRTLREIVHTGSAEELAAAPAG